MLKRVSIALRYDGSHYHGWQEQDNVESVQHCVEKALSRVANHPVSVICAGRTDAGVHATSQVIHFDTEANRTEHAWIFGANSNLPADISVLWAKFVSTDFHARYSALSRTYRYILFNHEIRPGILRKFSGWHFKPLSIDVMQQATHHLLGEHDFSAFRGSDCQAAHAIRTIHEITVSRRGDMVIFEVKANAFLLHMVRNIVGTLIAVGEGGKPPHWILDVLMSKNRKNAGVTAVPNGLYLVSVEYPHHFNLPQISKGPFFLD